MPRWRQIPDCPNYVVSDHGVVAKRRDRPGKPHRPLKQRRNGKAGKPMASVYDAGGAVKAFQVDRLVLTTFRGPAPSDSHYCRHRDGDPANCRLDNLVWARRSQWARSPRTRLNARVGRRVKAQRERLGLTRAEAADQHGVSVSAWTNWETGKTGMRVQTLLAIAETLQCSPRELLPE